MTPFERHHPRPAPPGRPAFTLVELMISIALVALLILGVNQVFLYTSQAIGAGQAIGDAVRSSRSVQTVLANDFAGIAPNGGNLNDSAFLSIYSAATPAFLNAADHAGDPLTLDRNGNGTEGESTVPGEQISPATYTSRNCRVDMLGFFTRGNFQRQTGNDGTFVANMSAPEAWVSYGHLQLPDNNSTPNYFDPGGVYNASTKLLTVPLSTNPNNYYATQFVLGRMAMLLRPASAGTLYDASTPAVSQVFVANTLGPAAAVGTAAFSSPLFSTSTFEKSGSTPTVSVTTAGGSTTNVTTLNQSRFDLGGASMKSIQISLETYLAAYAAANGGAVNSTWWNTLMGLPSSSTAPGAVAQTSGGVPARFECNPFVPKPLTAGAMAQASPYFLQGCSQFIVEYAGDFLTQNNDITNNNAATVANPGYGAVTAAGADGTLDYVLIPPAGVSPVPPRAQWRKQILWYGLPRNTSGQAGISMANGDVVPLRDWRQNAYPTPAASPYYAPFEKTLPTYAANYAAAGAAGMQTTDTYTCVFGPNDPAPKLIRITITLVDPTGRLPDGQTYQYVFPVPPQ
jgi:prepilin-type N-terminal cleavage/methylation domain-containing protein